MPRRMAAILWLMCVLFLVMYLSSIPAAGCWPRVGVDHREKINRRKRKNCGCLQ
jgi:hypothetical protein